MPTTDDFENKGVPGQSLSDNPYSGVTNIDTLIVSLSENDSLVNQIHVGTRLLTILGDRKSLISNPSMIKNVYKSLTGCSLDSETLCALQVRSKNNKDLEG